MSPKVEVRKVGWLSMEINHVGFVEYVYIQQSYDNEASTIHTAIVA